MSGPTWNGDAARVLTWWLEDAREARRTGLAALHRVQHPTETGSGVITALIKASIAITAGLAATVRGGCYLLWVWWHRGDYPNRPGRTK